MNKLLAMAALAAVLSAPAFAMDEAHDHGADVAVEAGATVDGEAVDTTVDTAAEVEGEATGTVETTTKKEVSVETAAE